MLTVHHLNQSRSKRVLWLLEELGMAYQRVDHQRDANSRLAPASLKAIHPLGKAPVIVDGDITLCESGAVLEYILDQAGDSALRPARGSADYYRYLEWSHFAEGSLALPVITSLLLTMESRSGTQPLDGYIGKEKQVDFSYIEATLTSRPYFAGDNFTAADIMMAVMLEFAANLGLLADYPHTLAYLKTMQQRPAYQTAAQIG
ncbi:glutathione S-transferase family protein [Pseudoalteromonas tunicata]|jgi:glutathione S-transferase|uniref:glutathione transferase n=1 Tax=Pseudoalteromonas tunicata D2 TaxID=87626 RepID=A4C3M5_9GAMM|nr:glutathione S-transferase family protein [Pseudoalteromonas tunicata]ATC96563.1 glutathione S-transferase [Pseudoalteromonas tunicata]AXT33419.1 glutathione S-transferase family protein [Pseudoalteromonas tunicata]EAR30157.1 glutathione S-transferase family protein [Pseudoalteromonas tunicata D2]